ncbi:MAG: hypothetical protein ACREM1_17030 [Longimicrobiales bacterium]
MSLFRPDRRHRGHDPYVRHKMLVFVTGAAFALAGIASERDWLVYIGIAVLFIGVLLRLASDRRRQD